MYAQTDTASDRDNSNWCSICKRSGHTAGQHIDLVDLGILKETRGDMLRRTAHMYGLRESDLSHDPDGGIGWTCSHGAVHPVGRFKGDRREHRCDCHCCVLQII
ncbi:hypothetical protein GQ472_01805 [archaeon]|nr:hypothetical protein [archaeon]